MSKLICFLTLFLVTVSELTAQTPPLPDLSTIPADLVIPAVTSGLPAPGQRVRQTTADWQGSQVHHLLYLPTDWQPGRSWPVIVEYAGNGGYQNKYGDTSDGSVEGSRLGYGLTAGRGCIWLCLPYLEKTGTTWQNAPKWWGDIEETKRYCLATLQDTFARYGGDPKRVLLCGFSRGSIACNYLGLHDDEIAKLWCGFLCHSHYDGVKEGWPYPAADRASALTRLHRLAGRPQFISHEGSITETETWLHSTGIPGRWTFAPLPFRNHSDAWTLRDIPLRQQARAWLHKVIEKK
jgi:hypothetical protein